MKHSIWLMLTLAGAAHSQALAPSTTIVEFSAAQAADGKTAYDRDCAGCHGKYLDDGQFAPPLRGGPFTRNWAGKAVSELFAYASTKMPPAAPGSLGARTYTAITAYLMQSNGVVAGTREMASTPDALALVRVPGTAERRGGAGGGLTREFRCRTLRPRTVCSTGSHQ